MCRHDLTSLQHPNCSAPLIFDCGELFTISDRPIIVSRANSTPKKPERQVLFSTVCRQILKSNKKKLPTFSPQDIENIKWFWRNYLRPKSKWLGIVFVLVLLQGLVFQQFLVLSEDGLRTIFEKGDAGQLIWVCAAVFGLFSFRGVASYVVARMSAWIASDAVTNMRKDLIDRLISLDLVYFERTNPGKVILKLVQQADGLATFVGQGTINAVRDILTIVIISAYLIYKQPILFMAGVIVQPGILLALQWTSRYIKDIQKNAQTAMGAYINGIEEMVNGMRTVKISGQENAEQARLHSSTENIRNLNIRLEGAQAIVLPTMDFASAFAYMLVIGGGGYMVLSPNFDVDGAGIITFLLGIVLVFDPARRVAQFFATLQASLVLLNSLAKMSRLTPEIKDREDAVSEFDSSGDIVFSDVDFSYDSKDQPLFKGLNMTLKGGKTTAIVGPTGSGKTTILSLMGRLYEMGSGTLTIGGTDIRDIKIETLRSNFSVVAQDVVIFNNSIFENIKYVAPNATDDEIWAAAEAAEIADLMREREGADVGPKGAQLSGGQRQRIAIARAFLRYAPIVILDEATSALDQRTEDKVKRALSRLSESRTTVTVAHRLSSVVEADQIYVLEDGSIVENGTHADLVEKDGLYAKMFTAQKKGYDSKQAP